MGVFESYLSLKLPFGGDRVVESLENRVSYVRGVTYKAKSDLHKTLDNESLVLLRANNIQNGSLVFDDVQFVDKSKVRDVQLLRKDDILICASSGSKGLVGKAALVQRDMPVTFGAFCCVLRPLNEEGRYLGHYFQSGAYRSSIECLCNGSNINNLKKADLLGLPVPRYDYEGRRRIVEVLDIINYQIDLANQRLTALSELVKSRFVEMFGDPASAEAKWPKRKVSEFCELHIGPFGSMLHKSDYISGGHPLVNPSHIIDGAIRVDDTLTIDNEKYSSLEPYQLHVGDVVLGRRGEIGRCAVVKQDGLLCGTGSMIIRPNKDCRSDFLQRALSFPSFAEQLENRAVGVTMKNLNAKIVGSAAISLPPIERQNEFASFAEEADKSRFDVHRKGTTVLDFNALMAFVRGGWRCVRELRSKR